MKVAKDKIAVMSYKKVHDNKKLIILDEVQKNFKGGDVYHYDFMGEVNFRTINKSAKFDITKAQFNDAEYFGLTTNSDFESAKPSDWYFMTKKMILPYLKNATGKKDINGIPKSGKFKEMNLLVFISNAINGFNTFLPILKKNKKNKKIGTLEAFI